MGQDVFVDVAYSGLEVGRRLKLREVGPRTAYLEHGTPMPVGSGLLLRNDSGLAIPVVVIRVHEQVAGAEMPPGMRIKAEELAGAAAEWWGGLVSREDPEIPELPTVIAVPPPGPDLPPLEEEEPQPADTAIMNVAVPEPDIEGGNGQPVEDASPQTSSRTLVMSAVDISRITGTAGEGDGEDGESDHDDDSGGAEPESSGGNGAPGSNGDEMRAGRRRTGRRRRRR